jgi:formylglycine-generating enzyme required for sulfatase activity
MRHLGNLLKCTSRDRDPRRRPDAAVGVADLAEQSSARVSPQRGSWPDAFVNRRDGSIMRLVPAGEFTMGSSPEEIERARRLDQDAPSLTLLDETPQFRLFIPIFYLSAFAVTNEQFARFLSELHPSPAVFGLWVESVAHIVKADQASDSYRAEPGFERYPAIHLTWFGALAYCQWAQLRLPTEVEWEKAARGTDARLFPWGDEWHDDFLCWHGSNRVESETTVPVDAYPQGCSPYGIYQMAGNVAEWCEDWYQSSAYTEHALGHRRSPRLGNERVLRGGTCLGRRKLEFRCGRRQASPPVFTSVKFTGLRCAGDLPGLAF